MKKKSNPLLIIAVMLCLSAINCYAQKAVDDETDSIARAEIDTTSRQFYPTTMDEFNYLVRQYKNAPDLVKKGYYLSFFDSRTSSDLAYEFEFYYLVREAEVDPIAAIFVIAKSVTWNNTYYVCIPSGNQEVDRLYKGQVNSWDSPMKTAFAIALSDAMINLAKSSVDTDLLSLFKK